MAVTNDTAASEGHHLLVVNLATKHLRGCGQFVRTCQEGIPWEAPERVACPAPRPALTLFCRSAARQSSLYTQWYSVREPVGGVDV